MYINRENEFKIIKRFIYDGVKIIYINVQECSGFSTFVQERFSDFKTYYINYDGKTSESMIEKLLSIMPSDEIEKVQQFANLKYGEYNNSILSAMANQIIPYIGAILAEINNGKKGINLLNYNIEIRSSAITDFLKEKSKDSKIGIFIDKAQYLNESDYNFIRQLALIKNLYIIVAYSSESSNICKLKLNFESINCQELEFTHPDTYIVTELSKLYNHPITNEEANDLLVSHKYNIHNIIYYLKNYGQKIDISIMEKAILLIMYIIKYEIIIDELIKILNYDKNIFFNKSTEVKKCIDELKEYGILRLNDNKLYLFTGCPIVENIITSHADIFYYKYLIINYYTHKESISIKEAELCYKLSKELKLQNQHWIDKIIIYKMQNDLPFGIELVQNIEKNKKLQIIAYTYLRLYTDAYELLKKIKKKEKLDRDYKKLYAVILNRCRLHKKAEKKLLKCLSEDKNNYILKAYLVSNYIHSENIKGAQQMYEQESIDFSNIDQGFFFRNCGAAFWDDLRPLEQALEIFKYNNELFGYLSTKCNLLTRKMMLDSHRSYSSAFNALENEFLKLGENNMHIFYNNWAIAELLDNNFETAHKLLDIAYAYSHSKMPQIFITINRACLSVANGEYKKALNIIEEIEHDVEEIPIDRVKQKYYINKALIYFANNILNYDIIEKCRQYPDRYSKDLTYEKIKFYQDKLKSLQTYSDTDFNNCFCPCYLEYWYINPLKLLSTKTINEILSI